jgi:metal-responsive CopG/Arc/MetJ family transcriptional regulator
MSNEPKLETNADRLLTHLKENSLAARIVSAYTTAREASRSAAIREIIQTTLAEIKHGHNENK